ncbi:hypothetical protein BEP19_08485 [Ammoniphilus oxalaticus]|uniref:Uncharacterized protein n=1 Tax=Ammoniphilus oxalaticus TaxID=66863 RepID=A0A419SKF6_9BACL|nr:ribonuclease H-like YkuK family protein [Ammoniphilus oxalaticus]RKD24416.1 hypothetical protein BEP19_08485 [Ammoniphilus oxalaticus]
MLRVKQVTLHDLRFQNTQEKNLSLHCVFDRVLQFIASEPHREFRFMIGTDSQVYRNHTTFVTGIVAQRVGKGVWACYRKIKRDGRKSLREKITMETQLTQLIASFFDQQKDWIIREQLPKGSSFTKECHLDIGDGIQNKTRMFVTEMIKVIETTGYQPKIKPYSYVASHYANYYTKLG